MATGTIPRSTGDTASIGVEQSVADSIAFYRHGSCAGLDINGLKSLPQGQTEICNPTPTGFVPLHPVYQDYDVTRVSGIPVNVRVYIGDRTYIFNYGSAITANSNTRLYVSYPCK